MLLTPVCSCLVVCLLRCGAVVCSSLASSEVPSLEGFSTAGLKQEEIVNLGIKEQLQHASFVFVLSVRSRDTL
eukprot:4516752-Amphidinium_carterae.1